MRVRIAKPFSAFALMLLPTLSQSQAALDWADGVGLQACSQLATIEDRELLPWVRGYWTGANLYLGGSDLCMERAHVVDVSDRHIRSMLDVHCAPFPEAPIMVAAFNALKGLPTVEGSRAAACRGN